MEVYSTMGCKYCILAKNILKDFSLHFENIDINFASIESLNEIQKSRLDFAKLNTVPQIYMNDLHIGGYSDLLKLVENDKIIEMIEKYKLSTPRLDQKINLNELKLSFEPKDTLNISKELKKLIMYLLENFSFEGFRLNYEKIKSSRAFISLKELIKTLKSIDPIEIVNMSSMEKIIFFSNLYNSLVILSNCTLSNDFYDTQEKRSLFFKGEDGAKWIIAGEIFSLDDIEHGILRCNKAHPSEKDGDSHYFQSGDSRVRFSVDEKYFDPRIHFILNCGALSCPPIQALDNENFDLVFEQASKSYLQSEIHIDSEEGLIQLPKLLFWYYSDFAVNNLLSLLKVIVETMPKSWKKEFITNILSNFDTESNIGIALEMKIGKYLVKFSDYDWSRNIDRTI